MAITKITPPSATTPILAGQYTQQNKKINANTEGHAPDDFVLTDLVSTVAAPLIGIGCYIRHAGNSYQVDTADEAISGSVAAGLNYVKLTVSGSVLLASWVTSFSGHLYNEAYGGWYSGTTTQILPQGVYLDGTTYNRVKSVEKTNPHILSMADGSILSNDKAYKNVSGSFLTGGDNIDTGNGNIDNGTGTAAIGTLEVSISAKSSVGWQHSASYTSSSPKTEDEIYDEFTGHVKKNQLETSSAAGNIVRDTPLTTGRTDYMDIYAIRQNDAGTQIVIFGNITTIIDATGIFETYESTSIVCNSGGSSNVCNSIALYV